MTQASILAKRSVYYPFDVSVVQDADKPTVQAHGKYLAEHADRNVRLEGNCDERGSNEYNLGLGQRRADGVKKIAGAGRCQGCTVERSQLTVKKSLRLPVITKLPWSQNRRTDLNYGAK